jgi:hypothetical protein
MSNFRIMVSNGIMLANKFLIQWATLEFYVIKHKLWVADKLISKFKEKHEIIIDIVASLGVFFPNRKNQTIN